ncbi:MAG: threonine/serine dehydratase [Nitrososphaerales archaeon]|jgi:threonine dehydratase
MERHELPGIADIEAARKRIEGVAVRTPLVDSPALSRRLGREVYLKLECFQPIRVFKIRGAYNKLSQVKEDSVVAVSSGNHGIAVAYSARAFGKKCTVFLPENPVKEKADAIAEYGAEIVKYGKYHNEREERARQMVTETGAALVHPFNDPAIIAGQGTCGLEVTEQLTDVDSIVVPVGGGGLVSGISIAVKARSPRTKIFGVEPATAAKLSAAMKAGRLVSIENPHSIADGLIPPSVGDLTFKACSENVSGVFTVTDEEILDAMKILIREARIFPEPSSAAPLAALLAGRDTDKLGKRVVLIVSGGNVSQKLLGQILTA